MEHLSPCSQHYDLMFFFYVYKAQITLMDIPRNTEPKFKILSFQASLDSVS